MNEEEHKEEALKLLEESDIKDSSPTPWEFVWDGIRPPTIFDADGKCVCTLGTGTLMGASETEEIIGNAKRLLEGNE